MFRMGLTRQLYGLTSADAAGQGGGEEVQEYVLSSPSGVEIHAITHGCIITQAWVPDREGLRANVALGLSTLHEYEQNTPFFGCVVGRYANRIGGARFQLDGREYRIATSSPPNASTAAREASTSTSGKSPVRSPRTIGSDSCSGSTVRTAIRAFPGSSTRESPTRSTRRAHCGSTIRRRLTSRRSST